MGSGVYYYMKIKPTQEVPKRPTDDEADQQNSDNIAHIQSSLAPALITVFASGLNSSPLSAGYVSGFPTPSVIQIGSLAPCM